MTDRHLARVLSPYHAGEQAVQDKLGVRQRTEEVGLRFIRPQMPEQHRQFFMALNYLFAASVDGTGQPWASILCGEEGFIQSAAAEHLSVRRRMTDWDPFDVNVRQGAAIGLLGLDLNNRRRNRANGRVRSVGTRIEIAINQSFGNCPKYIRRRQLTKPQAMEHTESSAIGYSLTRLSVAELALISQADTFFIASGHDEQQEGAQSNSTGLDISHRGGDPGFVEALSATELLWSDYKGNNFFNTFGNLQIEPRCGLLFVDFTQGHLLQLVGRARVIWNGNGSEKKLSSVLFEMTSGQRIEHGIPLRWQLTDN